MDFAGLVIAFNEHPPVPYMRLHTSPSSSNSENCSMDCVLHRRCTAAVPHFRSGWTRNILPKSTARSCNVIHRRPDCDEKHHLLTAPTMRQSENHWDKQARPRWAQLNAWTRAQANRWEKIASSRGGMKIRRTGTDTLDGNRLWAFNRWIRTLLLGIESRVEECVDKRRLSETRFT